MTDAEERKLRKRLKEEREKDKEDTFTSVINVAIEIVNLTASSRIVDEVKKLIIQHYNNIYWDIGRKIVEEEKSGHDWFKNEEQIFESIYKGTKTSDAYNKKYNVVLIVKALAKINRDSSLNNFRKEYTERDYTEKDFRDMKRFYLAFPDYGSTECQELIQNCMWSEIVQKLEN